MDRRHFLTITSLASGALVAGRTTFALARTSDARVTLVVRGDRQWMGRATHRCSGARRPLRYAGFDPSLLT